jgi:FMNH2-dependent dimethyl sulfone monooxygenase
MFSQLGRSATMAFPGSDNTMTAPIQFGLYVPQPNITVGSREIVRSAAGAMTPLPAHAVDPAFELSKSILCAADAAGFDIILFAERHLGPDLEAWIMASAIGSCTHRIRSMVAVHPGLWHPALIAKMAASLDRVSSGRMAINLVTGWNEVEHRMFGGSAMPASDDRYVRAEEYIEILRGLWTTTPYSYAGRFYQLDAVELRLRPATPAPPDIFTASRSERGLDMVAKYADWWFLDFPKTVQNAQEVMESLKRAIDDMDRRAAQHGRKVRYAFNPFVAFGASEEAAMEETLEVLMSTDPDADGRKIRSRVAPALKAGCIGPADKIREQIMTFHGMGIELLLLKFVPTLEEVGRIRDELIDPLRDRAPAPLKAAV